MSRILILLVIFPALLAQEPRTESWLGNLAPIVRSIHRERGFPMEFARRGDLPVEQWRSRGRAELERALSYAPRKVPLDLKVHSVVKRPGYEVRAVSFAASAHYRVPAYLLVPGAGSGPVSRPVT